MAESLSLILLFLLPVGVYLIWRWRRKGLLIEDILYTIGFVAAVAGIFYLPSEFEVELSKITITILEFLIAAACILLGTTLTKGNV